MLHRCCGTVATKCTRPTCRATAATRAPVHEQTLATYTQRLTDYVGTCNGNVILAGHSLAGLVISAVAESCPARIHRLIFVTGLLPRDGDSLVRICSVDPDNPITGAAVRTPDGKCVTIDPERLRELFYADCPAEDLALARERLGPEPLAALFGTVHVTPENFGRVPRAYIHCASDIPLPLFVQEQMVAASPCETVLTMECGHSPFFAAPERLATYLDSLQ